MEIVKTDKAPAAIGPYSQAVICNGFVFLSGQLPINPETGEIAGNTAPEQMTQVLKNITEVLQAAHSSLTQVVKSTLYITDMGTFAEINKVYGSFFTGDTAPARVCVEVSKLPKNVQVEMDVIACVSR